MHFAVEIATLDEVQSGEIHHNNVHATHKKRYVPALLSPPHFSARV
jgi:hypothetical protein